MDIYITDGSNLLKYSLPHKNAEVFSINFKSLLTNAECLITLNYKNDSWHIDNSENYKITQGGQPIFDAVINDYSSFTICNVENNQNLNIYAIPTNKEIFYKLSYGSINQFSIGNSNNCEINYQTNLFSGVALGIFKENENWKMKVLDSKLLVFKNQVRISNDSQLNIGDVIFLYGLKIIWMGEFIVVNNPNNFVNIKRLTAYSTINSNKISDFQSDVDKNYELYKDSDYFYHTPRIREILEEETIKISEPPGTFLTEELPAILTIGPMLTMGAMAFYMLFNVINGIVQKRGLMLILPQAIMCISMIFGSVIFPRITKKYQKKMALKKEEKRKTKYTEYLNKKEQEIEKIYKNHIQIMQDNIPSLKDCLSIIKNRKKDFWSRVVTDDDFLNVRLGVGVKRSLINVDVPEKDFTLDEDELMEQAYAIVDKYKNMNDVPVAINLVEQQIVAYICSNGSKEENIKNLLFQLAALHGPEDLKLVILTDKENSKKWEYVKYFPHCFSEDKTVRYFATNVEEAKEISNKLTEVLKERKEKSTSSSNGESTNQKATYKNFSAYYLIITDNYKNGNSISILSDVLKQKNNLGFSLLIVSDTMKNLPLNCKAFIEAGPKDGAIISKDITKNSQILFKNEDLETFDPYMYSRMLSSVPVITKEAATQLPSMLSFMEMFGVSKVEQLNIASNWEMNNPVLSLAAPVGVHKDGELFKLNLHEKNHGPHGLIAGSTGSGKSEFIITYILSMAVNYHPYEVQFVLIDYKGGGLAGAFENKETGVYLPHLAGTVTNLDVSEINRTLVSIQSELKRRQRVFNEVKDSLGESTVDIYKYQRLYREGLVKKPMSHLFIISDEFAELKSQQPEFMEQLISTARIGRSLGVHLILATQKPSGVVNDQIWSNSKFKVCLKVQNKSDSMEMLKRPEAASIKETGRFYLQVGYDDLFEVGQSAWSGAKYIPSDRPILKIDDSIDFIGNTGNKIKTIKTTKKVDNSVDYGDQLTNTVKYLYELAKREKIVSQKMWLEPLKDIIYLQNLKQKYSYKQKSYQIVPVIGEYDDPSEQKQGIVTLDLTNKGNTLIIGKSGSGKENLLSTILWSTITEHTPDEVNIYIMDFGAETLKVYNKMPHVGNVISLDESEKVKSLMEMLYAELDKRRELFADYGGSYTEYCNTSGSKLPLIITVINGYEMFTETYSKLTQSFANLYRDGSKYGIVFIITGLASNAIGSRLMQNFNNLICLQLANQSDYYNILNSPRKLVPASFFGRGLIKMDTKVFEFQTALFVERSKMSATVRNAAKVLSGAYKTKAKEIPVVPDVVSLNTLNQNIKSISNLPIGYDLATKEEYLYDFKESFTPVIANSMDDIKIEFIYSLITLFRQTPNTSITVIDAVNVLEDKIQDVKVINNDFDRGIIAINNYCIENKENDVEKVFVILSPTALKGKLSASGNEVLNKFFNNIEKFSNVHFILIDTNDLFRNLQFEEWYSKINRTSGIWLGPGIGNQVTLQVRDLDMDMRRLDFKYMAMAIKKGKVFLLKHVVRKDGEEENEE